MKLYSTIIFIVAFSFQVISQGICEGDVVIPTVNINDCDTNWVLVLEDEFNGNELDTFVWSKAKGVIRDPFFDASKYWLLEENVVVKDGRLIIIADEEFPSQRCFDIWYSNEIKHFCDTFIYTAGEIWSKNYFHFGKFEAMIKIPMEKGLWPAFWIYGESPRYNEIDIFEFRFDKPKDHNMDLHYDVDNDGQTHSCHSDYNGVDFTKEFHKFGLIWTPTKIQWLVDDKPVRTDYRYYTLLGQAVGCSIDSWTNVIRNNIFPRDPMRVILNIAIQSKEHAPDVTSVFPAQMEVDWVRIYRREP